MRIVVALGGNALLERGEKPDAAIQRHHIRRAARALAPIAAQHELVLCHGNGPQVGLLAIESEADGALSEPYPLDALGAQTQGMIGYWLAQELRNAGVVRPVVSVVTQTVVHDSDPAFARPTKFVGPMYELHQVRALVRDRGWSIAMDGDRWRRVVPSPQPVRIVEMEAVHVLVNAHAVVICGGGGGAPVVENDAGECHGVEAVVDKDLTAALIATELQADMLVLLTDVRAVMLDYGNVSERALTSVDVETLDAMEFPAGSMGPKVEACSRFVRATGATASIGALDDAANVIAGRAGTHVGAGPRVAGAASATAR